MRKFIVLLVANTIINVGFSQSQQVSSREAEMAASNWVDVHFPEYQSDRSVASLQNRSGHTLLYEIRFDSVFVLLSGSKACLPILGFYKGDISVINDKERLPCNLKNFIGSFVEEIDNSFARDTVVLFHDSEWRDLIEGNHGGNERILDMMPPLIKTKWGQSSSNTGGDCCAYNFLIPSDSNHLCLHQKVGCGAVALAQVMNYWQYPVLYDAPNQFDWCNMTDSLNYGTDSDYEKHRNAIAYLMYQCAEDINSEYGCNTTTSYLNNILRALVNQYGYSNSATIMAKEDNWDIWPLLIKSNLDEKHPVLYFGADGGVGHFFLCDGYLGDAMFHFNWGWNGNCDFYFTLDNLTPGGSNYNHHQLAILDIAPSFTTSICDINLNLENFYHDNLPLLVDYHPEKIVPQTMTTLASASVTSPVEWRTIYAGATAVYQAHREVILQDGFEAKYGSEFEARVIPCVKCGGLRGEILDNENDVCYEDGGDGRNTVRYTMVTPQNEVESEPFPNPTDGQLTMSTEGKAEMVLIHDPAGRPMGGWHFVALTETKITVEVSALRPGPYLLTVVTPSGTRTVRFLRR